MKYLTIIAIILSLVSVGFSYKLMGIQEQLARDLFELSTNQVALGSAVSSTASSDTLETFRTNTNTSFASLQSFASSTSLVGIMASTSPLGDIGIGTANATSSISGGNLCFFFQDEAGRGMWIKLATSGNTVFATSTTKCNT